LDLRQFRYFVVVAEELHFTRAAQRLNIGQPPLSLQIQAIERELGTELFRRNRRRVELTEAGRLFLVEARAVLAQAERAVETAKRVARGDIGVLRVGFTPSAPLTPAFTRAVRAYRLALPDVHLALSLSRSQSLLEALRIGSIDIGLIRPAAAAPLPPGITAIPVTRDRLMVALHADHPLASRQRRVPLAALAAEPFVLRPRGPGAAFYEQVYELCAQAGFSPHVAQDANEAPTILGLVAAGVGVSILPASFRAIDVPDVVWRDIAVGSAAISTLLLVYSSKAAATPQRTRFIELIRQYGDESADQRPRARQAAVRRSPAKPKPRRIARTSKLK
jgi:DNA-binding transcriptional LysR family regulator